MRDLRPALVLLLSATALAACGADEDSGRGDDAAGGETTTTAAPAPGDQTTGGTPARETHRCSNERGGFSVGYPADWHTNSGDVAPRCSYFDADPIQVPEAQEFFGAAIFVRREPVPFSRVTGGDRAIRVLEREDVQVAGRPAERRLWEATGEALLPEGIRGYDYLADLGGETLIASTTATGDQDFDRNRQVLDDMVERLELEGG